MKRQPNFAIKTAQGFILKSREAEANGDEQGAAWFYRAAIRRAEEAGTTACAVAAMMDAEAVKEAIAPKPPCCHVRVIRRFYAICKSVGLDWHQEERMRGAFSMALGKRVDSRESLSGEEWAKLGDMAERRQLIW